MHPSPDVHVGHGFVPDVGHGFDGGLPNGKYPSEVYWKVPRVCDLLHFLGAE